MALSQFIHTAARPLTPRVFSITMTLASKTD